MIPALAAVLAVLTQAPARAGAEPWTWSVYDHGSSVTLAHEVPDTDKLAEVMECARPTGQVKVTVYPGADAARTQERLETTLGARDPAFQDFIKTGKLTVTAGDRSAQIGLAGKDLQTLAKFAKLCGA